MVVAVIDGADAVGGGVVVIVVVSSRSISATRECVDFIETAATLLLRDLYESRPTATMLRLELNSVTRLGYFWKVLVSTFLQK